METLHAYQCKDLLYAKYTFSKMGNTPTVDEHEKLLEDFNYSPKGIRDFKESLKDFRTAFVLREVECTQPMKVLVGQAHQLELFFSNLIYVIFHRKPSKTTGKG